MNEKILKRKVQKEDFYKIYLKTLNGHLELTSRELDVLIEFCKLQSSYSNEEVDSNPQLIFGNSPRQEIRTTLGISPYNLNNIIKSLKAKGVLLVKGKSYVINPRLFVPNTDKEYSINFKIEIE